MLGKMLFLQFEKLFRRAVQSITEEEFQRIPEFRHREDALACLFGRLLLRHSAQKFSGEPWKNIKFERTERGKPYLANPANTTFGLNVSHQVSNETVNFYSKSLKF